MVPRQPTPLAERSAATASNSLIKIACGHAARENEPLRTRRFEISPPLYREKMPAEMAAMSPSVDARRSRASSSRIFT